jgi:hypothetical protein
LVRLRAGKLFGTLARTANIGAAILAIGGTVSEISAYGYQGANVFESF